MKIKTVDFKELDKAQAGFVIMGCDISTPEFRDGFLTGPAKLFKDEGAALSDDPDVLFKAVYAVTTLDGKRNDLVYVCNTEHWVLGRLAIVRLTMGDCKWIDDWDRIYGGQFEVRLFDDN